MLRQSGTDNYDKKAMRQKIMNLRHSAFLFFLWWSVIGYSVWLGGTVFSMSVIVPMWSYNLPQSALSFFEDTRFNQYIWNFFGPPFMLLRNMPLIICLVLGWQLKPHCYYLLTATVITAVGVGFTLLYIYPINDVLMTSAARNKPAAEINILAHQWIIADRLRFAVMLIGYFSLLRAFQTSLSKDTTRNLNEGN